MNLVLENKIIQRFRDKFPDESIIHDEAQSCLAFGFECGDGWFSIIYESLLLLQDEKFTIVQVKEKFGSLRIYIDGGNDRVNNVLGFLENQSEITCELCGDLGSIDWSKSWKKCRCEKCIKKEQLC